MTPYVSGREKSVNLRVCTPLTESCLRRVRAWRSANGGVCVCVCMCACVCARACRIEYYSQGQDERFIYYGSRQPEKIRELVVKHGESPVRVCDIRQ